jgi:hypothetical protein
MVATTATLIMNIEETGVEEDHVPDIVINALTCRNRKLNEQKSNRI